MYDMHTDGHAYAKIYILTNSNQTWDLTNPRSMMYNNDKLFIDHWSDTGHGQGFISDSMLCSSLLELPRFSTESVYPVSFQTERPTQIGWSQHLDDVNYGNLFALDGIAPPFHEEGKVKKETQCIHPRFVGNVADVFLDYDCIYSYVGYPDGRFFTVGPGVVLHDFNIRNYPHEPPYVALRSVTTNDKGFMTFQVDHGSFLEQPHISNDAWVSHNQLIDFFKSNSELIVANPHSGLWSYRYYDVVDSSSKGDNRYHIQTTYRFDMRWYGTYRISTFLVHLNFVVDFHPAYGTKYASDWNEVSPNCVSIYNFSSVEAEGYSDTIPWDPPAMGPGYVVDPIRIQQQTRYVPLFTGVAQVGSGFVPNFIRYRMYDRGYINRLHTLVRSKVEDNLPDIRVSAFLAASDALNSNIQVLSSNNLQNLQHLKDILSLLPDLPALAKLIAKAVRGDLSVIIDIIDYITEEVLKTNFQRAPIFRDLRDASKVDIRKRVESVLRHDTRTIHGKFNFTFQGNENFLHDGVLRLETRAKVRLHTDPSTLLTTVLTANSIGLLPSLSRIWSLLPFSFVVDWFTNESKRLKLVDTQLLYMMFRTSLCVYSYKVVYEPSPDALLHWGLESTDTKQPFGISVYSREISHYAPRLVNSSKFDYLRVTRGPDPVTVGSLMWQVLT